MRTSRSAAAGERPDRDRERPGPRRPRRPTTRGSRCPWALAGLRRAVGVLHGSATYGTGLARFVVIPLPPGPAGDVLDAMRLRTKVEDVPGGQLAVLDSGVVTAGDRRRRLGERSYLRGRSRDAATVVRRRRRTCWPAPGRWVTVTAGNGAVILTRGLTKRYGRRARRSTTSTSRCAPATGTGSSARTGPARRRRCGCCSVSSTRPAGAIEVLGRPVPRQLRAGAAAGRRARRGARRVSAPVRPRRTSR